FDLIDGARNRPLPRIFRYFCHRKNLFMKVKKLMLSVVVCRDVPNNVTGHAFRRFRQENNDFEALGRRFNEC
ncbi:MAG: hypothetical protein ABIR47_18235, partial [Candidatus Kapaibacterium sp.]